MSLVNYYCDMWERRLNKLVPLAKLMSSKVKFKWTKIVARNILSAYHNFIKQIKIHTYASDFQLVLVIRH